MNVHLSPQNQDFLDQQIASGAFPDWSVAVDVAIDLLRRRTLVLQKIDLGRSQLDAGDFLELDSTGLSRLFDELKARVGKVESQRVET